VHIIHERIQGVISVVYPEMVMAWHIFPYLPGIAQFEKPTFDEQKTILPVFSVDNNNNSLRVTLTRLFHVPN
jgi:hypothetical protein